jgi:alcohol dehydrogenase (NADP+)
MIPAIGYAAPGPRTPLGPMRFARRHPGPQDVAIEVLYCGVCHSDLHQVRNDWGNTIYPCLPGHEIIGRALSVGQEVSKFHTGDLVGVGCLVDSCRECDACRQGLEQYCEGPLGPLFTYNGTGTPNGGNTFGGYSNVIVVPQRFVLSIPSSLDPARAAPILCAGLTTYSPMRHWKVSRGQKVGVVGLGGLGHMAVKIAKALGARVYVFTTSKDKRGAAALLGADGFILSTDRAGMAAQALSFDFILSTIPVSHDINPYLACVRRDGVFTLVGALEPLEPGIDSSQAAFHRRSVAGSLIGGLPETQEVLDFCAEHAIQPEIEIIRIDQVDEAFERMKAGAVRFRQVIDMATLTGT